jgi:hypothetical protein
MKYQSTFAFITLTFITLGCAIRMPEKTNTFLGKRRTRFDYAQPTNAAYYSKAYERAKASSVPGEAEAVRNAIVYDLIGTIDYNYGNFESRIRRAKIWKDVGADALELGLAGAGATVGGAGAKTVLAAISTGVLGFDSSIDKNAFNDLAAEVIQVEMQTLRKSQSARISMLVTNSITAYPLEAAEVDVIEYYFRGTVARALQSLHEKSSQGRSSAQVLEDKARGLDGLFQSKTNVLQTMPR